MSEYSAYYVDLSRTGTGYAGTIDNPFSYEDFASAVNADPSNSNIYLLKGKTTLSSLSSALIEYCVVDAWDLEEFGPWRLEITDISKIATFSGSFYNGIILLDQTGDLALVDSSFYSVNFYRKTSNSTDKLTLGSASPRIQVRFNGCTFQSDGALEILYASIKYCCVYVENGISIPSTAYAVWMKRCTYNDDSTAITPDVGFSGNFDVEFNQDYFSFTVLSDVDDSPEFPTGITIIEKDEFSPYLHFDGIQKTTVVGAFFSRSGVNPEIYVDLDSGTPAGSGTEISPYNATQLYANYSTLSVGTTIKAKGFDEGTGSLSLFPVSGFDRSYVSIERWNISEPWGIKRDGYIQIGLTKLSGGIINSGDDFYVPRFGVNYCYISADRIIYSPSYSTYFPGQYYRIKGSTIISYGTPSRIGDCATFEYFYFIDSYIKDVGPADVGSSVYAFYNANNCVFSYASNSLTDFFDLPDPWTVAELNVSDSAFNVSVADVTFSTTYSQTDYLYPSGIYTALNDTSTLYSNKTGYSTGMSGNPRYGMGAYFFPPISAAFTGTPTSGGAPLTVSFTDGSTGIILNYSWDFGDTSTGTSQNPVNVYSSDGTYTVTLTVTGPDSAADTLVLTDYITVATGALSADFTVVPRVGTAPHTVVLTDASTGTITSREWVFGDGYSLGGNDTSITYTYEEAGIYTVQLTVSNGAISDVESKTNYVAVNPDIATPDLIIAKSESKGEGRYWNFYLDQEGHLIFENESVTYRSVDKIIDINKWTFVQFNPGSNKMYAGDPDNFIREINMRTISTSSPESPTEKRLYSALNSSIVLDELRIWYGEQDLTNYFRGLWGRADGLSS